VVQLFFFHFPEASAVPYLELRVGVLELLLNLQIVVVNAIFRLIYSLIFVAIATYDVLSLRAYSGLRMLLEQRIWAVWAAWLPRRRYFRLFRRLTRQFTGCF
jgi:hypothetical protein